MPGQHLYRVSAGTGQPALRVIMYLLTTVNILTPLSTTDDQQLMLAYQSGDMAAFEALYSKHKDALYRYVLRHGLPEENAEEVYQEIWSAVIKARKSYQPAAKFTTWIYQIARNKVADYYRQSKNQFSVVAETPDEIVTESPVANQSAQHDFRKVMSDSVAALPIVQRETFLMYYEAALSIADIARITHCDDEAVKSRLRYAVNKIKASLGEDHA